MDEVDSDSSMFMADEEGSVDVPDVTQLSSSWLRSTSYQDLFSVDAMDVATSPGWGKLSSSPQMWGFLDGIK